MGHAEILMELTFQLPFICTGSGGSEGAGAAFPHPSSPPPPHAVTQTFMLCWFFLLVFITFDIANNEP